MALCWSEYDEWLEEQYTEAAARGLECNATRYGVEFLDAAGSFVEEHDKPEGLSDKPEQY